MLTSKNISENNFYVEAAIGDKTFIANNEAIFTQSAASLRIDDFDNRVGTDEISWNLNLGYNLIQIGHLVISPEIFYTHGSHSQYWQTANPRTPLLGLEKKSIKFGDQYGLDVKLGYQLNSMNNIYMKLGWAIVPTSTSTLFSSRVGGLPPLTLEGAKNLQGLLFGIGLAHSLTKHLSLFIDWTTFRPRDYYLERNVYTNSFGIIKYVSQVNNIAINDTKIGFKYKF